MQLMWLSGPTGNVRTISITTRTVLTAAVVVGLFLVTAGFLLHFVGFKIAVEYNPDLARSIGGVTTEAEQKRMESIYRDHLTQLRESPARDHEKPFHGNGHPECGARQNQPSGRQQRRSVGGPQAFLQFVSPALGHRV